MGRLSGHWLGVVPAAALCCAVILGACGGPEPGSVKDEAMRTGLTAKDLPGSDDDYLRDMDRGLDAEAVQQALLFLSKEEAWKAYNRGRNNWVVWTAGNDTLWDYLANNSFGAFAVRMISSRTAPGAIRPRARARSAATEIRMPCSIRRSASVAPGGSGVSMPPCPPGFQASSWSWRST